MPREDPGPTGSPPLRRSGRAVTEGRILTAPAPRRGKGQPFLAGFRTPPEAARRAGAARGAEQAFGGHRAAISRRAPSINVYRELNRTRGQPPPRSRGCLQAGARTTGFCPKFPGSGTLLASARQRDPEAGREGSRGRDGAATGGASFCERPAARAPLSAPARPAPSPAPTVPSPAAPLRGFTRSAVSRTPIGCPQAPSLSQPIGAALIGTAPPRQEGRGRAAPH